MNGALGGARLEIAQHTFELNQRRGIGWALCIQHGIEIFDGDGLPARSMMDLQLRFPVKVDDFNL